MRRDGMTGPHGADFARSVVTDREDEIHHGRAVNRKLVPAFGTVAFRRKAGQRQSRKGKGIDATFRKTTGRIGVKASLTFKVQQALGEDRARRISRAKEQDIVRTLHAYALAPLQHAVTT